MTPGERVRMGLLYVAHALPLLWPFVLLGAAGWLVTDLVAVWSWRTLAVIGLAMAFLGSLRAYSSRWNRRPEDVRPVSQTDQPGLWRFVEKIAADQSARVPDGLIVNASAECRWFDRWTPFGGIRSHLVIGQWVIELFSLGELKALLSLRLACVRGLPWEQRRARLRQGLALRLSGEDHWSDDDFGAGRMMRGLWWFSAWPVIVILKVILWNEGNHTDPYADDETACRLAGTDATLLVMAKSDRLEQVLKGMDKLALQCADGGFWVENLFTLTPDAIRLQLEDTDREQWQGLQLPRTPTLARDREWFDLGASYASNFWVGFPEGDRREERAKRNYLWNEADSRPSTLLIDKLSVVRRELTARQYRRLNLELTDTYPVSISLLRRWLYRETESPFPASAGQLYAEGRLIEPGSKIDRESSQLPEDEAELWHGLPTLYDEAGKVWLRWSDVSKRLEKIAAKNDRSRKDDIQTEHLQRAKRDSALALAGFDHRLHVIHRQLAARIDNPKLVAELARRTEAVVRFQTLVSQARQWTRVLRRDRDSVAETMRPNPRFLRDVHLTIRDALDRLEEILDWCKHLEDTEVSSLIEQMPLDRFLCSHTHLPDGKSGSMASRIEETWRLWREVRRKADWLHIQLVAGMVRVHEDIVQAFADHMEVSVN